MKKLMSFTLALTLALALTGCTPKNEAYNLYVKADEALTKADSVEMATNMKMTMDMAGQSMEMESAVNVKQAGSGASDMVLEMDMTVDGAENGKAYYSNGYYYMDMAGMKYKIPMPLDDAIAQAGSGTIEFPESAVLKQESKKSGDDTEITLELDGKALNDILAEQMSALTANLGVAGEDVSLTFGNVALSALIGKDGNFKTMRMSFSMSMDMSGQAMDMKIDTEITVVQIGGVAIELPDDLDTYAEMTF